MLVGSLKYHGVPTRCDIQDGSRVLPYFKIIMICFLGLISPIYEYEEKTYYMELYFKFNMDTIIRHQLSKLFMTWIN